MIERELKYNLIKYDTCSRKEDCIAQKNEGASRKVEETLVRIGEI